MLMRTDIQVSEEDLHVLNAHTWYLTTPRKYVATNIDGKPVYLHQMIVKTHLTVDHKDNNKLNCRRDNLRVATYSEQNHNRPITSANTSGYKGVVWNKAKKMWMAQIKENNKNKFLGYFLFPTSAAEAYNKEAIRIYGEFANINEV